MGLAKPVLNSPSVWPRRVVRLEGNQLDPWSSEIVKDYKRVMEQFGLSEPTEEQIEFFSDAPFFRRRIIFAHRDLDTIVDAIKSGREYAVLTGIKPTGDYHLGTFQTVKEFVYFQKKSPQAIAVFSIADIEAWEDNGIGFEESRKVAISNVSDLLAAGLDLERAYIYFQSKEIRVHELAALAARGITLATMKAVYGERHIGLYLSSLVQIGDILLPQHPDLGGPKPTIVPVGIDQDPHLRLTRDVASKLRAKWGFVEPASTYHLIIRSLLGDKKMSKRDPMSYISLRDDENLVRKKILNAFTGGRETAQLQRELGGEPWRCVVYEIAKFHLYSDDDSELEKIYKECISGARLCGECKMQILEDLLREMKEHEKRRIEALPTARRIVEMASNRQPLYTASSGGA